MLGHRACQKRGFAFRGSQAARQSVPSALPSDRANAFHWHLPRRTHNLLYIYIQCKSKVSYIYIFQYLHIQKTIDGGLSVASMSHAGVADDAFRRTLLHDVLRSDTGPAKNEALPFEARRQPGNLSPARCLLTGRMRFIGIRFAHLPRRTHNLLYSTQKQSVLYIYIHICFYTSCIHIYTRRDQGQKTCDGCLFEGNVRRQRLGLGRYACKTGPMGMAGHWLRIHCRDGGVLAHRCVQVGPFSRSQIFKSAWPRATICALGAKPAPLGDNLYE